jgi:hypothetical protein
MDNPNARELLKEARAELAKAHDHLMELTAKLPMQYFGLVDGNIIQVEDCLIDQIDAYLAAPSESAMEMVERIRKIFEDAACYANDDHAEYSELLKIARGNAAALIEGYGRRVPRKMLQEVFQLGMTAHAYEEPAPTLVEISAKHGIEVF